MSISAASRSEKARRAANEDAHLALIGEELGVGADALFIVADGMGGRASGAIASSMAVNAVRDVFASVLSGGEQDLAGVISQSLRAANDAVYKEAHSNPELEGMGTTCVALAIRDGQAFFGHMGDSRAYLLRNGELKRLTEDHSFVAERVRTGEITEEQARKSRFRNVITRAVGLEPDAEPEVDRIDLHAGDVVLLCTDGLTTPMSETEIVDILQDSADVEEACDRLVGAALRSGGRDNITAVAAAYGPRAAGSSARKSRRGRSWVVPAAMGLVLGLLIGMFAGWNPVGPRVEEKPPAGRSLAHVTYQDPVSLLYVPLQGRILALDGRGYLHVVDRQGRLMRVDTSGRVIYEFPAREGFEPSADSPSLMAATDRDGNLYISDPAGKRILKFGPDGLALGSIGEDKLSGPQALAVDDEGSIYVIDAGRLKAIRVAPSRR